MPAADTADRRSAGWLDDWRSTASPPLGNWPAYQARHSIDDAPQPSASPSWERTYHRYSTPRSVRGARSPVKPTRAPWPTPDPPTSEHWQRNAKACGAALTPPLAQSPP